MAREPDIPASPDRPARSQPVRTCIGCRERATRRELLRVTAGSGATGEPVVVPDPDGTAPGRGAHLHPTRGCYDLAVRRKAFSRALRVEGGLSSAPVGEYLDRSGAAPAAPASPAAPTDRPTDRNWSTSS